MLIAIGDLHGHVRALERILAAAHEKHAILRDDGGLRAGVTVLTTGDHFDRGEHGLEVIAALQRLERGSGEVVCLFGNHELMALAALDVAAHVAKTSISADPVLEYAATTAHGRNGGGAFVREFGATPRAALRSYVARMARDGDIGGWIRRLRPAHHERVAGRKVLFTHGDVAEDLRDAARLDSYLGRISRRLGTSSAESGGARAKWGHADFADDESIFWDRSFVSLGDDANGVPAAVCRALSVDFIVTGHTPQKRITAYGERIFRIDVGMTPTYGEHTPEALVFTDSGISALRADGRERMLVAFGSRSAAA